MRLTLSPIDCSRSRRQAHTDGDTNWMVRTPASLQLALEAEVEVGRVDADEQRDVGGEKARTQLAPDAEELGKMCHDFRRSRARRASRADTMPRSRPPPCAARRCRRIARSGTRARTAWISVAASASPGRLACHDPDGDRLPLGRRAVHNLAHHRTMPRPDSARNAASGASAGADAASPASLARASSRESPSR